MKIKESKSRIVFNIINAIVLGFIVCATLYPFIYILSQSFSSSRAIMQNEVYFFPVEFNVEAYSDILIQPAFWLNYKNTVIYTVLGTLTGLTFSTMCAYPISKKNIPGFKFFTKFILFTMFFQAGLIPTYLLINNLGMVDKIWSIILPYSIPVYNVLIMRTFFRNIPESLEEAGQLDGLSQIGVLIRIVLPLSKPIMATMTLFLAVFHWNDWFIALIYLNDNALHPVTLFLRNIVVGAQMAASQGELSADSATNLPQSLQAATTMLIAVPIICVYPFVQKYFVQGVMLGSVKE